ncbi:hypothetical protein GCM10011588_39450 [Nocardia jinanensis]|uniref:Uncharacterized protein n=1 Tax=Nocardia jinanensis TaxID=382504 RepID=A0A917RRV6_9NOCA|nr:hypothetical protein GCM10011588_39450 [Nocardia jinanensis]
MLAHMPVSVSEESAKDTVGVGSIEGADDPGEAGSHFVVVISGELLDDSLRLWRAEAVASGQRFGERSAYTPVEVVHEPVQDSTGIMTRAGEEIEIAGEERGFRRRVEIDLCGDAGAYLHVEYIFDMACHVGPDVRSMGTQLLDQPLGVPVAEYFGKSWCCQHRDGQRLCPRMRTAVGS